MKHRRGAEAIGKKAQRGEKSKINKEKKEEKNLKGERLSLDRRIEDSPKGPFTVLKERKGRHPTSGRENTNMLKSGFRRKRERIPRRS